MQARNRNTMTENELHEYVAEIEGHEGQVTGVVGFFYRKYRDEVRERVKGMKGEDVLEIGCGEGMMFDDFELTPVQMDVSMRRLAKARAKNGSVLCADGYHLPFKDRSFSTVLLVAVLEHTREPWRILAEAHRVLKPGGKVVIVVPNDITMSAGRLILGKFPIRYPDHVTFTTPGKLRAWLSKGFIIRERFPMPFRFLPFGVNLFYFIVAEAV